MIILKEKDIKEVRNRNGRGANGDYSDEWDPPTDRTPYYDYEYTLQSSRRPT